LVEGTGSAGGFAVPLALDPSIILTSSGTLNPLREISRVLVDWFGPMKLDSIRPRHTASYIADMSETHGASSVRRDVDILHAIFKSALAAELVQANPVTGAERPPATPRWRRPVVTYSWPVRPSMRRPPGWRNGLDFLPNFLPI
jgi:hypothetical protein